MKVLNSFAPLVSATTVAQPKAELLEQARAFEAAFLTPMIDEALRTAGEATFGAGQAETVWRSFMAGAIAEEIAEGGSTGIAETVAKQMAAYQT